MALQVLKHVHEVYFLRMINQMRDFLNTIFILLLLLLYWKALSYLKEEKGRGWEQQYWFYWKNKSNTIIAQEQGEERVGKISQLLDPFGKCNCVAYLYFISHSRSRWDQQCDFKQKPQAAFAQQQPLPGDMPPCNTWN